MKKLLFILISGGLIYNSNQVLAQGQPVKQKADTTVHFPDEKHLTNIRQLTFGGDNAEAYFSFDSKSIVFQMTNPDFNAPCDQIFASTLQKFNPKMVSTGMGIRLATLFYLRYFCC